MLVQVLSCFVGHLCVNSSDRGCFVHWAHSSNAIISDTTSSTNLCRIERVDKRPHEHCIECSKIAFRSFFSLSLLSLFFISTILRKIRIEFNCAKNCVFRFVHSFDREGRPLRVLTASHNSIFQTIFCLKVRECARSRKFEVFRFHSVVCWLRYRVNLDTCSSTEYRWMLIQRVTRTHCTSIWSGVGVVCIFVFISCAFPPLYINIIRVLIWLRICK